MGICGYNFKIGNGLKTLLDGMVDSMETKANKATDLIALDNELRELDIMISKMQNKGVVQDIFVGLNIFAKQFFIEVRKEIINNPELTIREVSAKIIPAFVMTIKEGELYRIELERERDPEENDDPDFAIKIVADWVADSNYYNEPVELSL